MPTVPGELWRIDATGGEPIVEGIHHCNGVGSPVTSACLGEDGDLIVVTASGRGEQGSILRTHVAVAGLPIHAAHV